ncbi:hypothetical protein [Mycolicibacterium brisbanense]
MNETVQIRNITDAEYAAFEERLRAEVTINQDPQELTRLAEEAEQSGDLIAAAELRYLAVNAQQMQVARERGTVAQLERARVSAAVRLAGRLGGLTAENLDTVRLAATHWLNAELDGTTRSLCADVLDKELIRKVFVDDTPEDLAAAAQVDHIIGLVEILWPDIVMESVTAARPNPAT